MRGSPASRALAPRRPATHPAIGVHVDPATLPRVAVDADVIERGDLSNADAQALAVTLAENLVVEGQAVRHGQKSLLAAVDDGDRLITLQGRVDDVVRSGRAVVPHYTFDSLHLGLIHSEGQSG